MKAIARCVFAALLVLAMTGPALGQGKDGDDIKNCYSVRGEARYGAFAYKHVVIVTNRCKPAWTPERAEACSLSL